MGEKPSDFNLYRVFADHGWADPGAALLMVPWLVKEGKEGLAGDDCS